MLKKLSWATIFILVVLPASAQHPFKHWTESIETRYNMHQPVVDYLLTVDSTVFSSFAVDKQQMLFV